MMRGYPGSTLWSRAVLRMRSVAQLVPEGWAEGWVVIRPDRPEVQDPMPDTNVHEAEDLAVPAAFGRSTK